MKRFVIVAAVAGSILAAALVSTPGPIMAQNPASKPGSSMIKGGQMMKGGQMAQRMKGPNLVMPRMDPVSGRKLFASKGCVVCHSVNGIGGKDAAALDASTMPGMTNPFDFVAKMWQGAPAMIAMQTEELKQQTTFTGQELADIIAFLHDPQEQKKFSEADIPPKIKEHMEH